MYIADFLTTSIRTIIGTFADDTVVTTTHEDLATASKEIQNSLDKWKNGLRSDALRLMRQNASMSRSQPDMKLVP